MKPRILERWQKDAATSTGYPLAKTSAVLNACRQPVPDNGPFAPPSMRGKGPSRYADWRELYLVSLVREAARVALRKGMAQGEPPLDRLYGSPSAYQQITAAAVAQVRTQKAAVIGRNYSIARPPMDPIVARAWFVLPMEALDFDALAARVVSLAF